METEAEWNLSAGKALLARWAANVVLWLICAAIVWLSRPSEVIGMEWASACVVMCCTPWMWKPKPTRTGNPVEAGAYAAARVLFGDGA